MPKYGQIGYEAYADATGGKTFDGREMPKWSELPERIENAWEAAAAAITRAHARDVANVFEELPPTERNT